MKTHTPQFKEEIKKFGRQLDSKITYQLRGETIELGSEDINSITPTFQGDILKSTMKQLDIDSNVDIPLGAILKYQFGVLVDGNYEYLDFGNYVVYSSEKQEDTRSYKLTCYDLMLYTMTDYNELQTGEFPMTVKEYLECLCHDLSLEFANSIGTFTNYDKIIPSDLYANLGYTYRDIFDELAQVTASTICINDNNQVEVRYIQDMVRTTINGENNELSFNYTNDMNILNLKINGKTENDKKITGINNLLEITNYEQELNGIKITVNEDKSITINGKATANTSIYIPINLDFELNKKYIYSTKNHLTSNTYTTSFRKADKSIIYSGTGLDGSKNSLIITPTENRTAKFMAIYTIQNVEFNNYTIYPMVEEGEKEHSFVPYGKWLKLFNESSNDQLIIDMGNYSIGDSESIDINNGKAILNRINGEKVILGNYDINIVDGKNKITLEEDILTTLSFEYGTYETIDEEYLKDINVNFGEKYGPINSIVLSRAGGSDNVYLQDERSIEENGLHELKISDNQIMNGNNRSDYLPGILERLDGLEYYLNDFSSTGICYLDLCDRYNIKVGDNIYSCIMFNDEINIAQGLEENIHTDMPEESQTDYTKADKTDRRINETYLIVDKQNQQIEGVISQTTEQNSKIARISATVDELNAKISDIADITVSGETSYASLQLNNINQSEPIYLKVRPIIENISYLYPNNNLFPSNDIYPGRTRTIRFENIKTNEIFDYELEQDLLYFDGNTYDTFELSYDGQTCRIVKRCAYNDDGEVIKLDQEEVFDYDFPEILLTDGDYIVSILGYNTGYIYTTLMASNIYTTQFATRAEVSSQLKQTSTQILSEVDAKFILTEDEITQLNSKIDQTAGEINLEVSKKVGNNEVISRINQTPEQIKINANKLKLEGYTTINNGFSVDLQGNATMNNAKVTGGTIRLTDPSNPNMASFYIGESIYRGDGILLIKGNYRSQYDAGSILLWDNNDNMAMLTPSQLTTETGNFQGLYVGYTGTRVETIRNIKSFNFVESQYPPYLEIISNNGSAYGITVWSSDKRLKKNIKNSNYNAIDTIKKIKHREFDYKNGKHCDIGYVADELQEINKDLIIEVGNDKIKQPFINEIIPILSKAIQEQQEIIENLQNQINELKEMINNGNK